MVLFRFPGKITGRSIVFSNGCYQIHTQLRIKDEIRPFKKRSVTILYTLI